MIIGISKINLEGFVIFVGLGLSFREEFVSRLSNLIGFAFWFNKYCSTTFYYD